MVSLPLADHLRATQLSTHKNQILILKSHLLEQIIHHAEQGYPYEICGLAGGRGDTVETVTHIPNASPTPHHTYDMERQAMVDAIVAFQRAGQGVLAIYHSHPDGDPVPSERDIAEATWPDAVYIIIGVSDTEATVKGWLISGSDATPVDIVSFA
jgi:desampylase